MAERNESNIWERFGDFFKFHERRFTRIDEIHDCHDTLARLNAFEIELYEISVLLNNSTIEGLTPGGEMRYSHLKSRLMKSYLTIRPYLLAYLRLDVEDKKVGRRTTGLETDTFEAIWVYPKIESFIEAHDVFFRDRVSRALQAISDYNEHLHCLLETRV